MNRNDVFKTLFGAVASLPALPSLIQNFSSISSSQAIYKTFETIEEENINGEIIEHQVPQISQNSYSLMSNLPKDIFQRIGEGTVKEIRVLTEWSDGYKGTNILWTKI